MTQLEGLCESSIIIALLIIRHGPFDPTLEPTHFTCATDNILGLQAFLEDSFSGQPGAMWVERGLYRLYNARNGLSITQNTWSKMISPGAHVHMSMLISQDLPIEQNEDEHRCPAIRCNGILRSSPQFSLKKWFVISRFTMKPS
jgi:hypothetical protein